MWSRLAIAASCCAVRSKSLERSPGSVTTPALVIFGQTDKLQAVSRSPGSLSTQDHTLSQGTQDWWQHHQIPAARVSFDMQVSTSTIASWMNKNEHKFLFEWNIYVSGQVLVLEGNKTIIKDEWKRTVTRGVAWTNRWRGGQLGTLETRVPQTFWCFSLL